MEEQRAENSSAGRGRLSGMEELGGRVTTEEPHEMANAQTQARRAINEEGMYRGPADGP